MNNVASVAISNSTREFDKEYHYLIPESMREKLQPGMRVIVPFGKANRSIEAYVTGLAEGSCMEGLKEIKKQIDETPALTINMIRLAKWMKDRYICTYADAIRIMLPPGTAVKSLCVVKLLRNEDNIRENLKLILDELIDCGNECEYEELKKKIGARSFKSKLDKLIELGCIEILEQFTSAVKSKTIRVAFLALDRDEVIEEIESNRIKRIQQIRILEMLLDNEFIAVSDIVRFSGVSAGVLNTLKKYGYIDFKDININRDPLKGRNIERTMPLVPTEQQHVVLSHVKSKLDKKEFGEILLHGVTGSGKTEVYLQLIDHCLKMDKQAIVLVPEISLTPQMIERFKGRFGGEVAVLHSRLSLGERFDQWRLIRDNRIKVVVGARSAVFAPFSRLGLIIIDEEHEDTYKSEITPKYHARDIARERCRHENAVLINGSATPSIETCFRAKNGQIGLAVMTERANNMTMPPVELVDMRKELDEGNRTIFSRKLALEIEKNIDAQQQTILFLNRRGHASFVLCRSCGYTVKCLNCNISLTYHSYDDRLICHYCGFTVKNPEKCPKCGSVYIRHFGTGTQKVEEDIKKSFTGCSVIRMDMDTTNYKNSHEEILSRFRKENINILVGTQMIAKGHDFPNVTLVGVLAADSLLSTGDYRAAEKTFQLITQVSGRAGRGEIPGRVVLQSYNIEDFSILTACRHDYKAFYDQEIKLREVLDYPPFTNIAVLILSSTNDRLTFKTAKDLKVQIDRLFGASQIKADILGPTRSPLSKIKNKYRWRIVIKCKDIGKLIDIMTSVSDEFYKGKKSTVDMSVDINPVNML